MGLSEATMLAIGSIAMSGVSAFVQIQNAKANAKATAEAARQTFEAQDAELTRQQKEANRVAAEEKSDVIRRADAELGTIRAAAGGMGASGTSFLRLVNEVGAVEGMDLGRVASNRKGHSEALQAQKRAARQGQINTTTQAYNRAKSEITSAALGFVTSGLQIASTAYYRSKRSETDKNKRKKKRT